MAGGRTDGAIGIHRHDVQIAFGEDLHIGTQLIVDQLQQVIGIGGHIGLYGISSQHITDGAAVSVCIIVAGHGDKIHILHLQPALDGSLGEPEDVLKAQVRGHILLEHLHQLVDLGDVLQLQKLLQHRFQKGLLGPDAADVAVLIAIGAVPEADHAHGLLPVQKLIALVQMDGQVLKGVVVIHIPGYIEPDPAHGIHDLSHGLPLHDHLKVRLKAHQLRDLLVEVLDAPVAPAVIAIDGVDLLDVPGHVDHGIPGDGHDRGLLIGHVIAGQQHGIRVAATACVPAQNQDCIVVLALPLAVAAGTGALTPVDLLHFLLGIRVHRGERFLLGGDIRSDEEALPGGYCHHPHRQHHSQGQQQLLLPGQPAGFLGLLFLGGLVCLAGCQALSWLMAGRFLFPHGLCLLILSVTQPGQDQ